MTKHVVFGDCHLHPFSQFAEGTGAQNSRLLSTLSVVEEIRHYCAEKGITSAICLGDIFHSRTATRFEHFNSVFDVFSGFKDCGINLTIIAGNHDFIDKAQTATTIDTFSKFARVVTSPGRIGKMFALPYQNNFEGLSCWLSESPNHSDPILLTHLDIVGAKVTKGWTCDKGVDADSFRRFKLVLSGHFHLRQQVKEGVYYIGACCPQNFGEEGEPGYFCTLDDESAEVEWHYTSAPRFVRWDPRNAITTDGHLKGNYVKALMEPNDEAIKMLVESDTKSWIFEPPPREHKVLRREEGISVDADLKKVVETYATVHAGDLPVDKLVNIGKELLDDGDQ